MEWEYYTCILIVPKVPGEPWQTRRRDRDGNPQMLTIGRLGLDRWELVQVIVLHDEVWGFFKREHLEMI